VLQPQGTTSPPRRPGRTTGRLAASRPAPGRVLSLDSPSAAAPTNRCRQPVRVFGVPRRPDVLGNRPAGPRASDSAVEERCAAKNRGRSHLTDLASFRTGFPEAAHGLETFPIYRRSTPTLVACGLEIENEPVPANCPLDARPVFRSSARQTFVDPPVKENTRESHRSPRNRPGKKETKRAATVEGIHHARIREGTRTARVKAIKDKTGYKSERQKQQNGEGEERNKKRGSK